MSSGVSLRDVGLLDRFRRSTVAGRRPAPVVHSEVMLDEVRWAQPFHWGLLIAHDSDADWEVPSDVGKAPVAATTTCLAIAVRHAQDVQVVDDGESEAVPPPQAEVQVVLTTRPLEVVPDYDGTLRCPSGRLQVGDADEYRLVQVPAGDLRAQVWLEPEERARRVVIALQLKR